jgi:hypothetical protein
LVGLVPLTRSKDASVAQAGMEAAAQLLTPTPPTSSRTASAVATSLQSPSATLPPQASETLLPGT